MDREGSVPLVTSLLGGAEDGGVHGSFDVAQLTAADKLSHSAVLLLLLGERGGAGSGCDGVDAVEVAVMSGRDCVVTEGLVVDEDERDGGRRNSQSVSREPVSLCRWVMKAGTAGGAR